MKITYCKYCQKPLCIAARKKGLNACGLCEIREQEFQLWQLKILKISDKITSMQANLRSFNDVLDANEALLVKLMRKELGYGENS